MSQWYRIHDKRTNKPVTVAAYFTAASAQSNIDQWKERQRRGGRPDITKEDLDNMVVVPVEIDIPNHIFRQVDNVKN